MNESNCSDLRTSIKLFFFNSNGQAGMRHDFTRNRTRRLVSRIDSNGNNCRGIDSFMVIFSTSPLSMKSIKFDVTNTYLHRIILQCQINGLAVPWTTLRCTISSFRTEMGYTVLRKIRDIIASSLMEKQTENYRKYTIYIVTLPSGAFSTNRLLLFVCSSTIWQPFFTF